MTISTVWSDQAIYIWIITLGIVTYVAASAAIGKISGRGTPIKHKARNIDEKMERFFTKDLTAFLKKAFVVLVILGIAALGVGIVVGGA